MTTTAGTTARFDVGRVIRNGFGAVARRPVTLLLIGLLVTFPTAEATTWANSHLSGPAPSPADFAATWRQLAIREFVGILAAGFGWITNGAVAYCVGSDAAERKLDASELLGRLMSRAPALYALGILTTLGVLVGTILLIVPGIIISLAWSMGPAVAMLERRGFLGVLRRSAELTRGNRGQLFGLFLVIGVANSVLAFGLRAVSGLALLPSTTTVEPTLYNYVLQPVLLVVVGVVTTAITTAAYLELRTIKEGIAVDGVARLFD